MGSKTGVDLSIEDKELVILGTEYAGEMKKGVFTVANYFAPKRGILSIRKTHYDKNSSFKAWPKRLERGKSVYWLDRR